jgi:adenine-specific DNA methylase
MEDWPRLIEHAFPLEQASLDSVHEKNVRHGNISTLHIWPARRPLAACRAALIATLLPDPGTPEKRKELVEKIGGVVKEKTEKKRMPNGRLVERIKRYTEGGILHWGAETENEAVLDWFREEIRKTYGGRAPKVLDPFAGGGAIPLEAMRLGCEATAIDINPVAWFILKCTLEYPQKLAGQKRPLPDFVRKDREFMDDFLKAHGFKGAALRAQLKKIGLGEDNAPQLLGMESETASLEADLAWHVRAWGRWVLGQARKALGMYYPTYADYEPLIPSGKHYERRERVLVPLREDGTPDIDSLNQEFSNNGGYLDDATNPRWVSKPTIAYLWARTVTCKNCRANMPLVKTRWLCRKARQRVVLTVTPTPGGAGVTFGVQDDVPVHGGNAAQRRENDRRVGAGTMSRSGASCPCCGAIMTSEDIRLEGRAGRMGRQMMAAVVDGPRGKEYRIPTDHEEKMAITIDQAIIDARFADIPFGLPSEPTPKGASRKGGGSAFTVYIYGLDKWSKLFTPRQIYAIGSFLHAVRAVRDLLRESHYPREWQEAISMYLAAATDRVIDRSSMQCHWDLSRVTVASTFVRFALPINWDFCEANIISTTAGSFNTQLEWIAMVISSVMMSFTITTPPSRCVRGSAINADYGPFDVIITDPPYYDAIPYSDLMDYYYVWLRRMLSGLSPEVEAHFTHPLGPKWDHASSDGELIDDSSRHGGDSTASKTAYEEGMFRSFQSCYSSLTNSGRLVVVFAHKHPDAWEALVSAIIRAGFVVDASWPIQTEMGNRSRAHGSAALSSSIWLICRKRPPSARVGFDVNVLNEMRQNIAAQLHEFWDAGIRGPDFVWAATGPALEAYSKHPVIKKANQPRELLEVPEFLRQVRRLVVDFVVGRVISPDKESTEATGLDDVTTYYLLHRHDFGLEDAPAGPCILYAVSCGLSDTALADQHDILARTGGAEGEEEDDQGEDSGSENEGQSEVVEEGSGSKLRLKQWYQRTNPSMGYDPSVDSARARADAMQMKFFEEEKETPRRRQIPLIDQATALRWMITSKCAPSYATKPS